MVIAASAVLVVLTGIYVLAPLFREPKGNLEVDLLAETDLDRLMNHKAVIYRNLKDLELEYKMGRLGEADFRRLEAGYKAEAAEILQKLDQIGVDENLDDRIEAAVAGRKDRLFPPSSSQPAAVRNCPSCGSEIAADKKFCPDCGQKL